MEKYRELRIYVKYSKIYILFCINILLMEKSVTEKIWKIINSNPCIRRNLSSGLINTRALARHIIEKYNV